MKGFVKCAARGDCSVRLCCRASPAFPDLQPSHCIIDNFNLKFNSKLQKELMMSPIPQMLQSVDEASSNNLLTAI
jgi:hypothetical protein